MDEQYKLENRNVEYGALHEVGNSRELAQKMIDACHNQEFLKSVCYSTKQDVSDHFD